MRTYESTGSKAKALILLSSQSKRSENKMYKKPEFLSAFCQISEYN